MSRFLNSKYKELETYIPGEQPRDTEYIKLNTNESPYPPCREAVEALKVTDIQNLRLYNDPECTELKSEMAKLYGVNSNNIYLSNGSDDILNFCFMAFSGAENKAYFPDITYGFYKVFANLYNVDYISIPLKEDFTINKDDYFEKDGLVVIANPNAPTGILLSLTEIEEIVKHNSENIVVIDEAYIDFGGVSAYNLTKIYNNLIVVCTFSKSRSLAGARLGFAIADSAIIADLEKIKYSTNPYNVNSMTQILGEATIKNNAYYIEKCREIMNTREFTIGELEKLDFNVLPSWANFIFAESGKIHGESLYKKLKEKGILVRHFSGERISNFNRITIGTREQMELFILRLTEILKEV